MGAQAGNCQVCPHCFNIVEKSAGCNHMTCTCQKSFCYRCGGTWPCTRGQACERSSTPPTLNFDLKVLLDRRHQRRHAFLAGACCPESVVSYLPNDVLNRIIR